MAAHTLQSSKHGNTYAVVLVAVVAVSLVAGVYFGYTVYKRDVSSLQSEIGTLQVQMDALREQMKNQSRVVFTNISLTELYENVSGSVVMIRGYVIETSLFGQEITEVQGSGFVYNFTGRMVVITNFHVVDGATGISVTFTNGNAYSATVRGDDSYADLAVLDVIAPEGEFKPLPMVSSSTLKVGDPVIAIGNPFGLTGTMTTGVVSQLGRTITEETTGGYSIANIVQFDAPINPGNSGGPLLNDKGHVVGVTTAIVEDSQGLGFAIPSDTILREVSWLVNTGAYTRHSWLGVRGTDMNYDIAEAMSINKTYGWLIIEVISGSPAEAAELRGGTRPVQIGGNTILVDGDIIVAMQGVTIINGDALSAFLEEETEPDDTITLTVIRNGAETNVPITLRSRPPS